MSRAIFISIAISVVVSLASSALLAWYLPSTLRVGTVDLAEIYRIKEQQISAQLTARGGSAESREAALREASDFGDRIEDLIGALPRRCGCLVLARSALLGSPRGAIDLTADLRGRLGL
jgi:hypothetical protein